MNNHGKQGREQKSRKGTIMERLEAIKHLEQIRRKLSELGSVSLDVDGNAWGYQPALYVEHKKSGNCVVVISDKAEHNSDTYCVNYFTEADMEENSHSGWLDLLSTEKVIETIDNFFGTSNYPANMIAF